MLTSHSISTQTFSAISVKPVGDKSVDFALENRPWTQCPNDVCGFREVRKVLSSRGLALYRFICRNSLGRYSPNICLSTRELAKGLGWSRWSVDKELRCLVERGLVLREYVRGRTRTPLITPIYEDMPFDRVDSWVTDQIGVYGAEGVLLLHGLIAKARHVGSWDFYVSNSWVRTVCNVKRYGVAKVLKKLVTLGLIDIYYVRDRRMVGVRALPDGDGVLGLVSEVPQPDIERALERERVGREEARELDKKKKGYAKRRGRRSGGGRSYEQSFGWPTALTKEAHINTLIPTYLKSRAREGDFLHSAGYSLHTGGHFLHNGFNGGGGFRDLDGGRKDAMEIHRLPEYITKKNFKGNIMKYPHPADHPWFASRLSKEERMEFLGMTPCQELYEAYGATYQYGQKNEILRMGPFLRKMFMLKRRPHDGEMCCDEQMVKALGKYLHKAYPRHLEGLEKAGVRLDINHKSIELIQVMKTECAFADKKDFYEKFFQIEKKIAAYNPPDLPSHRADLIEEFPCDKSVCEDFVDNRPSPTVASLGGEGEISQEEGKRKIAVDNSGGVASGFGSLLREAKRSTERMQRDPERMAAAMAEMAKCTERMKASWG